MEVKIDLMTKEEMLQESYINKGNRYTTEEWQENGDYVTTDRNGYLNYANGEEVIDESDLPEDGWFDCTGYDEDSDVDSYSNSDFYDMFNPLHEFNSLYDSDDEW